ncbi:uncharacterized protein LOC132476375 isoform X2 [Mesoplodon densirostris]|uniref:uncharacterized protein LOC132476375 isoform X2 n=1 Tax=Mesoplodon densirostris TaxID=48708 RepID=UPI0028DC8179|nr:uncharacterized protein LOC132476375 isoform X2 [Mesoplodon densirostris]
MVLLNLRRRQGGWHPLLPGMWRKGAAGNPKLQPLQPPWVKKVSHSEEFLTQISTELTDEALFVAAYHMNPVPIKEKQTQDQGTQISQHAPRGMWDLTSQTRYQTGTPCSGNVES